MDASEQMQAHEGVTEANGHEFAANLAIRMRDGRDRP